jgi:uncharacterized protein (TIGR04255 family)
MALYSKLKSTPIKEIIFTVSFNGNVSLLQLEQFTELPIIRENFSSISRGFHTQITKIGNNEPISTSSPEGFLLRSQSPVSRILHVKRGSLAFHKVNGYEPFENIYKEITSYWNLFKDFTAIQTIGNLSLRYVNFIEVPDGEIVDLLSIQVKHPFSVNLEGFFTQLRFRYDQNPIIDVNVVVSKARDNQKNGVVLDIILNKRLPPGAEIDAFLDMREAKNNVFFDCITEAAVTKFNI